MFLGPQRPIEVEEVLREAARLGTLGEIVKGVDVLDGVDAVAAALHLYEHGPLRSLAHPGMEEILPRVVVRAQRAAVGKSPRAACRVGFQQHVHQLPEGGVALHVVVLAFVDAPRLRAVALGVRELGDVVAIAERHLAERGFGHGRKPAGRDVSLCAVVQHGAAELADVPVERVAVVAHVRVLDVEAAVLRDLRVRARVLVALAVVEHTKGIVDDGERVGAREAWMSVEHWRRDWNFLERFASARRPRGREARVGRRKANGEQCNEKSEESDCAH